VLVKARALVSQAPRVCQKVYSLSAPFDVSCNEDIQVLCGFWLLDLSPVPLVQPGTSQYTLLLRF
jgi:hypothetical protein